LEKKIKQYNNGNRFGKPFHFFGDYLLNKYNCKVLKIPINANLSCPNRDGTLSRRGCIFCSEGSATPIISDHSDILTQMDIAVQNLKRQNSSTKFIAYFQAYTNTYGPVDNLKKLYNEALSFNRTIGLMVGTRPDCLSDTVLDLIASYKKRDFELWLEIGMQSIHNKSLEFLNRGHLNEATIDAVKRASTKGIPVCLHIILGIPGESWKDMMKTADKVSSLPVNGVKFHHMHIIKGTQFELMNKKNKIKLLSLDEYASIICDFIERLNPDTIIHRLFADREENTLIAPQWGLHKGTVTNKIFDEFNRRGTYQGFLFDDI